MNIPPKYEDVVAELEVLREGIIALNPESILKQEADYLDQISTLQQRLTVAEQRAGELEGMLREVANLDPRGEFLGWQLDGKIEAALKPAVEPHKCIECESQYCHGVCVERGDDDERYKDAEGEGS